MGSIVNSNKLLLKMRGVESKKNRQMKEDDNEKNYLLLKDDRVS